MIESRPTWRQALTQEHPLLLPIAHDALSALVIEQVGFSAYSIGGFSLVGTRYGLPDLGLASLGDMATGMRDIIDSCSLPVLVDADNGYGDVKNVTRTVHLYESMGASGMFIEDQETPKRCGHMEGKAVVPTEHMEAKIRAAVAARRDSDTFIIARTDARAVYGLDEALERAERYLRAGADGLFVEAPQSVEELERIARTFDVPQLANMLEDGTTPMIPPKELGEMGFAMVSYPTTLLFRVVKTMQKALVDLKLGRLDLEDEGISYQAFKELVGLPYWARVEAAGEEQSS